jgi:site-specific DNA-methyltransferase (cytosine-N4-specific)
MPGARSIPDSQMPLSRSAAAIDRGEVPAVGADKASISAALAAFDWDFSTRRSHSDIEGLHPYPAKFVAELPRAILDILPISPGTSVLDPYCGSGTTLVECQRRGITSVGVDLNPIACLMTRVKTGPLPDGVPAAIHAVLKHTQLQDDVPVPAIPNLDHWFLRPIQKALAALASAIASARPEYLDLFRLALSSIIVRVSNQESDTRYAAIEKNVSAKDVYFAFARSVQRIVSALAKRDYLLSDARVIEADTLALRPDDIEVPIGLVITSPPYPNAYEYWLYHKYRMWWLGYDPLAVKAREIGARAHFFKTKHHTADNFRQQMDATFRLLQAAMMPGGYACFVVGRSKIHGTIVDNSKVIDEAAAKVGFKRIFAAERTLSPNRKSFNLSHANIKTETIMVLRLG